MCLGFAGMDRHVCQNCILVFSSACAWLTRRLTNVKVSLAVSRFMLASLVRILRGQITKKNKKENCCCVALLARFHFCLRFHQSGSCHPLRKHALSKSKAWRKEKKKKEIENAKAPTTSLSLIKKKKLRFTFSGGPSLASPIVRCQDRRTAKTSIAREM